MTEKIYDSETGRYVGSYKIREYNDKEFGELYIAAYDGCIDVWFNDLEKKWMV